MTLTKSSPALPLNDRKDGNTNSDLKVNGGGEEELKTKDCECKSNPKDISQQTMEDMGEWTFGGNADGGWT